MSRMWMMRKANQTIRTRIIIEKGRSRKETDSDKCHFCLKDGVRLFGLDVYGTFFDGVCDECLDKLNTLRETKGETAYRKKVRSR